MQNPAPLRAFLAFCPYPAGAGSYKINSNLRFAFNTRHAATCVGACRNDDGPDGLHTGAGGLTIIEE